MTNLCKTLIRRGIDEKSTCLLIDDEKDLLTIIKKTLMYKNYKLIAYKNPKAGMNSENFNDCDAAAADLHIAEYDAKNNRKIEHSGKGPFFKVQSFDNMLIGHSHAIEKIKGSIGKIAAVDSGVLIAGESGTGKEVIANLIHENSIRSGRPFIKVNCAAIPESLIESELFGYEKGAFTGATKNKRGKLELADKGTLFLDEVGDLSLLAQTKLLRAIQEKEITRVGSEENISVDFRLICATNKDIKSFVKQGIIREDFYYRINVVDINVPPLRERREDIPLIIDYLFDVFSASFDKTLKPLSNEILQHFIFYRWPGNVRELKNVIERLFVFANNNSAVKPSDLPSELLSVKPGEPHIITENTGASFKDVKYEFEKKYLMHMLIKNNWNITNTAREIGLSRRNLHEKINHLNLKKK